MTATNTGYRGLHKAPTAASHTPLHRLYEAYGVEVYTNPTRYGMSQLSSREAIEAALRCRDVPECPVTIYRALPKGITVINAGDWVTTSATYALIQALRQYRDGYEIARLTVPASTLYTKANLLEEYGYDPS